MEQKALQHLLQTVMQMRREAEDDSTTEDVISVSETVSVAVSVYETVRNTLEYDEEHLLRRNATRRILKRRLGDSDAKQLATKLIRELIWARYLPNHKIPNAMIQSVADVFEKYKMLFAGLTENTKEDQEQYEWLLDVLSTEIEYLVGPPCIDEALASYAYQVLRTRTKWQTKAVSEADQDLQLYIAVHRAVLKSNEATIRYRIFTLYYPKWRTANANDAVVREVAMNFRKVYSSVEQELKHASGDAIFRFVRRHTVVFRLIADVAQDNPEAFQSAIQSGDVKAIDKAITAAAKDRYGKFRSRLMRTVFRAAFFLLLTKSILAFLVEYPYEVLVLQSTYYLPLMVNILFPPFLLALIGLSVKIPEKKNTEDILAELHAFLGLGEETTFVFKQKKQKAYGVLWWIFHGLYAVVFLAMIVLIASFLRRFGFNSLSITFFVFFLSLVAYFGIRIRNTRRDLLLIENHRGFFLILGDILFLPMIRAGRWISIRAPRVNIFLFFFDFIIEAPFKALVELIENWLAFLREKREEI
ncbi:hypothetical protein A2318_03375 [Candidatus Uhrbacteria bacterium RIFOXYB2_FULL_45_11]|uniref:Uncharacterized protein n=1 Tax=Candidatus Uhrbacteria bacterium RIFOXYB2_FULL_45_11 TaxID=1802421 RepID=A0A1F7W0V5_9BACT|nr:MAG: hypothetical protein A2318_03375 [Candidatus Uhrbacteria bacterium RIFOXYB2_FULL_45_11]